MTALAKTQNSEVKYLLNNTYQAVYSKLENILNKEELTLFAKPIVGRKDTVWETSLNGIISDFSTLNEQQQEIAAVQLQQKKASILSKLEDNTEFKNITEKLFKYPMDKALKVVQQGEKISVVITQWACNANKDFSIYGDVQEPYTDNNASTEDTKLTVTYSDAKLGSCESLIYSYNHSSKTFETDDLGSVDFGSFRVGSELIIGSDELRPNLWPKVVVKEGQSDYEVSLPFMVDVEIKVLNQLGNTVEDTRLLVVTEFDRFELTSLEDGHTPMQKTVFSNEPILVELLDAKRASQKEYLKRGANYFEFRITEKIFRDFQVGVRNENGGIEAGYTLYFNGVKISTQQDGLTEAKKYELDDEITVTDDYNSELRHTIRENENIVWIDIITPKPPSLQFTLVDFWNKPYRNKDITVHLNDTNKVDLKTTDTGEIFILLEDLDSYSELTLEIPRTSKKGKVRKSMFKKVVL
jgi:hypothetical protein